MNQEVLSSLLIEELSDATNNKHVVETLVDKIINYSRVVTFK